MRFRTITLSASLCLCAKLPENAGEDSYSILPVLLDKAKQPIREATIHQAMAHDVAIRQGSWKLIVPQKGSPVLFDLDKDLGETQNIANQHPEVVEKLSALLKLYISEGRSTPGKAQAMESTAWQFPDK